MRATSRLFALPLVALTFGACSFGPPVQVDAPLEGTTWEVVEVRGIRPPADARPTPFIVVRSGIGEVAGNSGCNAFNGSYRATGNELVMGPFASTRMACPGTAVSDFETILIDALSKSRFYVIRLNELFLYEGREAHVRLRRADR